MNKQGKIDIKALGYVLLIIIGIYLLMRFAEAIAGFFGFSLFSDAFSYINYILLLILWIIIQIGLIYGYYKIIRWGFVGFSFLRTKIFNWTQKIQGWIVTH